MLLDATAGLDEAALATPSLLPGWTRQHVIAHVAANADALRNLLHWARSGVKTPMYSSPEARIAGIQAGLSLSPLALATRLRDSAEALNDDSAGLTPEDWSHEVVTAQGRTIPVSETAWMRSREVAVHAVDLALGITFADLPADFCSALIDDVLAHRSMASVPEPMAGSPVADIAAWLTGRPHALSDAPELGPWI